MQMAGDKPATVISIIKILTNQVSYRHIHCRNLSHLSRDRIGHTEPHHPRGSRKMVHQAQIAAANLPALEPGLQRNSSLYPIGLQPEEYWRSAPSSPCDSMPA